MRKQDGGMKATHHRCHRLPRRRAEDFVQFLHFVIGASERAVRARVALERLNLLHSARRASVTRDSSECIS